ncbi:MAG: hypothetical protein RIQ54_220 [Candidatus Parcubacteria bacterium]|jgi:hypothetical protein
MNLYLKLLLYYRVFRGGNESSGVGVKAMTLREVRERLLSVSKKLQQKKQLQLPSRG